jgi:pyruvate,water dikinase
MHALWEGLTAIPWAGPPPVNAKGFLSVMFQCTRDPCLDPGVVRPFVKRNHIIISKRFCNLTSRLGFHHTTAEAFVGDDVKENYASFEFKGGAACLDRRQRRVQLIGKILQRFGFYTDIDGDDLLARLDAKPSEYFLECLKVLGYLMTHTRQLDMVMCSDASVQWYYQELMKKMSSFLTIVD